MTALSLRTANPLALALAAAGILTALLVGALLAMRAPLGIALLMGAIYAPLAALNLRLGIALWIPLTFLEGLAAFNAGGKAAGLLLTGAWFGALVNGIADSEVLRRHRRLIGVMVVLMVWLTLSIVWSTDAGRAFDDFWHWWAVGLVFLLIATTMVTEQAVRWLVIGFVVGGVLAVLAGIATGEMTKAVTATSGSARLGNAAGDPNFMAAGLVASIILAAALFVAYRGVVAHAALAASMAIMAFGLVATQSRAGLVAAAAAMVCALFFFKRRRLHVIAVMLVGAGLLAAWVSVNPQAFQRITDFDNGGSGRTELWTVAWRVFEDNPIIGVGINNFPAVSRFYVRERVGNLQTVELIAEDPHLVHNVYLQLLVENGVIGLALFLVFAGGCLLAAWRAGKRFEALGETGLEAISRGVLVAGIGLLVSGIFLSLQVDRRLWILFALGPALLHVAHARAAESEAVA